MITCSEINRFIKQGKKVYARVSGFSGEQQVFRARVGICDVLQVQFLIDGERYWRNCAPSGVRVEEATQQQCERN